MSIESSSRDPVEKLAEEFAARYRRGERPSLTEYTEQYPELAEQIRDLFPALVIMEQFGSVAGSASGPFRPGAADRAPPPEHLGDYRILREVGRGGMGIVYEAVQESLGRHVALKILPFHQLMNPIHLERFRREARAAAQLHHTNIVPVFGIGEAEGVHYYAMQFIQGHGLDVVLEEVRRLRRRKVAPAGDEKPCESSLSASIAHSLLMGQFPLLPAEPAGNEPTATDPADTQSELASQTEWQYCRSVAQVGVQVAQALAYAHKQRILHRDIKPSNLLLDTQGTVWITDFGLAKAEGSADLTTPGDIVGTVRFMAPERFQGKADPRSDVYSTGITLYEMLTLRPAFADSDPARLVERVVQEDPPRPRKLVPHLPRDLETIIWKAMAKEPAARYPTAEALAEDLQRFVNSEPIHARPVSQVERLWRWCRRKPLVAGLAAAVGLLAAVVALVASVSAFWLATEAHRAQQAEHEAKDKLWRSHLDHAHAARMSRQAGQSFHSLEALSQAAQIARQLGVSDLQLRELRNEAVACLALTDLRTMERLEDLDHAWTPWPVAFDAGWELYARSDHRGNIRICRRFDGQEMAHLPGAGHRAGILAFSPDGRCLAAKYWQQNEQLPVEFVVWDWRHNRPIVRQACQATGHADFAFTPDSRHIFLGSRDNGSLGCYELILLR